MGTMGRMDGHEYLLDGQDVPQRKKETSLPSTTDTDCKGRRNNFSRRHFAFGTPPGRETRQRVYKKILASCPPKRFAGSQVRLAAPRKQTRVALPAAASCEFQYCTSSVSTQEPGCPGSSKRLALPTSGTGPPTKPNPTYHTPAATRYHTTTTLLYLASLGATLPTLLVLAKFPSPLSSSSLSSFFLVLCLVLRSRRNIFTKVRDSASLQATVRVLPRMLLSCICACFAVSPRHATTLPPLPPLPPAVLPPTAATTITNNFLCTPPRHVFPCLPSVIIQLTILYAAKNDALVSQLRPPASISIQITSSSRDPRHSTRPMISCCLCAGREATPPACRPQSPNAQALNSIFVNSARR